MDVKLRESRERQFCNKKYTNAFVNGIPVSLSWVSWIWLQSRTMYTFSKSELLGHIPVTCFVTLAHLKAGIISTGAFSL